MSLFGDLSGYRVQRVRAEPKKTKEKQPTLKELAEEKFGSDRKLMMWIENFLAQKREAHILPTRMAWQEQLNILEEWPQTERIAQVRRSITNDYRALAYPPKVKKKSRPEPEIIEEEIDYSRGF